ncbi:MAG: Maf family protein [Planctomycetota bacterium]
MIWLASRSPRRVQLLAEHGYGPDLVRVLPSGIDDSELEPPPPGTRPDEWAVALAWLKARATMQRLLKTISNAGETELSSDSNSNKTAGPSSEDLRDPASAGHHLIIGADTVVEVEGEMLGQPTDLAHARQIICRLNNRHHRVLTGVALLDCRIADSTSLEDRNIRSVIEATTKKASGRSLGQSETTLHLARRLLFVDTADVEVGNVRSADIKSYLDTGDWRGKAGAYNLSERLTAGWPITYEGDPTTIMGLPMGLLQQVLGA